MTPEDITAMAARLRAEYGDQVTGMLAAAKLAAALAGTDVDRFTELSKAPAGPLLAGLSILTAAYTSALSDFLAAEHNVPTAAVSLGIRPAHGTSDRLARDLTALLATETMDPTPAAQLGWESLARQHGPDAVRMAAGICVAVTRAYAKAMNVEDPAGCLRTLAAALEQAAGQ